MDKTDLKELIELKNTLGMLEMSMYNLVNEICQVKNNINKLIHTRMKNENISCIHCDHCSSKK